MSGGSTGSRVPNQRLWLRKVDGVAADPAVLYRALRHLELPDGPIRGEDGFGAVFDARHPALPHRWVVGFGAQARVVLEGGTVRIRDAAGETSLPAGPSPLRTLREALARATPPAPSPRREDGSAPSWIGRVGLSLARRLDRVRGGEPPGTRAPDAEFVLPRTTVSLSAGHGLELRHITAFDDREVIGVLDRLAAHLAALPPEPAVRAAPAHRPGTPLDGFAGSMSRTQYEAAVRRCLDYIGSGDVYQAVLSLRFARQTRALPLDVFDALRSLNPSPYSYLVEDGAAAIAGASPELMVAAAAGSVHLNPIAGTTRRGPDPATDRALIDALLDSEKDAAEHAMLVDLGRNDLGRIARYGSVRMDAYRTVESYSHVSHVVSRLSAHLRDGADGWDALAATFPAGTVSGAPKLRALEIIDELEGSARDIYSGAVGLFDPDGSQESAIAIRTAVFRDGVATVQAGAGIVADSDPSAEYDECVNKASGVAAAIRLAEERRRTATRTPVREAAE